MSFDVKSKIHRLLKLKNKNEKAASIQAGGYKKFLLDEIDSAAGWAQGKKVIRLMVLAGEWKDVRNEHT